MHLIRSIVLVVVATFLLTFSSMAIALAASASLDSRNMFILSLLGAGLAFAALAAVELRRLHRALRFAAA